jgi:hypothetical protein
MSPLIFFIFASYETVDVDMIPVLFLLLSFQTFQVLLEKNVDEKSSIMHNRGTFCFD